MVAKLKVREMSDAVSFLPWQPLAYFPFEMKSIVGSTNIHIYISYCLLLHSLC